MNFLSPQYPVFSCTGTAQLRTILQLCAISLRSCHVQFVGTTQVSSVVFSFLCASASVRSRTGGQDRSDGWKDIQHLYYSSGLSNDYLIASYLWTTALVEFWSHADALSTHPDKLLTYTALIFLHHYRHCYFYMFLACMLSGIQDTRCDQALNISIHQCVNITALHARQQLRSPKMPGASLTSALMC